MGIFLIADRLLDPLASSLGRSRYISRDAVVHWLMAPILLCDDVRNIAIINVTEYVSKLGEVVEYSIPAKIFRSNCHF